MPSQAASMSQQAFDQQANELERARQASAIEPLIPDSPEAQDIGADGDLERSLKRAEAVEAWLNQENELANNDTVGAIGSEPLTLTKPGASDNSSESTAGLRKALVAIDQRNSQWQDISDGLPAGTDLLLLNSDRSGLSQIKQALQAGEDAGLGYSSLAVIGSEGSDGLLLGSDSLSGGESDLAELGDDLVGEMRVKLFSSGIAPAAAEPTAVEAADPAGIATVVGESANELLVDARLTLRTAEAKGTIEAAVDRAFDEANRDDVSQRLNQFLNGKTKPEINWASFDEANVQGAFISSANTILISEELKGSSEKVQAVVLEEIGHWLEADLGVDSQGDEGEWFRKEIQEEEARVSNLEEDQKVLLINNKSFHAELSTEDTTPPAVDDNYNDGRHIKTNSAGDQIIVLFNENLKNLDIDETQFTLRKSSGSIFTDLDVTNAYISGKELILELSRKLQTSDIDPAIGISYEANSEPGISGKVTDESDNSTDYFAGSLHSGGVRVGWGSDTSPEGASSIEVTTSDEIYLQFPQSLDAESINPIYNWDSDIKWNFLITVDGTTINHSDILSISAENEDEWGNADRVKIELATGTITTGSTVELLYGGSSQDKTSGVFQNRYGTDVPRFTA